MSEIISKPATEEYRSSWDRIFTHKKEGLESDKTEEKSE